MATKAPQPAAYERSDVCAVPAASVIVENVVAFEIAAAVVEKYVGTSLEAIRTAHDALHSLNRERLAPGANRSRYLIMKDYELTTPSWYPEVTIDRGRVLRGRFR